MPQVRFMDNGTLRTATRIRLQESSVLHTVQRIRAMVSGTLRTVYQYFSATATPNSVSGSYNGSSAAAQNITTGPTIASAVGGVAPFTYLWTQVDVSPYTWTISASTSATTTFTGVAIDDGVSSSVNFKCTITDANSNTADTLLVDATVHNRSTA